MDTSAAAKQKNVDSINLALATLGHGLRSGSLVIEAPKPRELEPDRSRGRPGLRCLPAFGLRDAQAGLKIKFVRRMGDDTARHRTRHDGPYKR
jgi:hypothetical protein